MWESDWFSGYSTRAVHGKRDERSEQRLMSDNVQSVRTGETREKDRLLKVGLRQQFGNFRLNVDFQVSPGLIVLFGSSGAGKSLTLRSMAGLLHPGQGYVTLGEDVLFDSEVGIDLPPQERHVGYVPQHYALFPHLTVAENIAFALPKQTSSGGWRKRRATQNARVSELLVALELKGLEHRFPSTLSGGQQQRVALARALAAEPHLLLLDEPFNALDVAVRQRLRDALRHFQRRFALPIVLVTHDHEEVQQLADTVVVLQHGQVKQVGSVQEVFFAPRTAEVAQLVGQQNIFGGYLAVPAHEQSFSPSLALRVSWLQSPGARTQFTVPQENVAERCWLPLSTPAPTQTLSPQTLLAGCIRSDEMLVHRLSDTTPPVWTARGSVQWIAELLEAQLHGSAIRLLVRPQWTMQLVNENALTGSILEIYLSRVRWREIEVEPGQSLVLDIGPEAMHWFEVAASAEKDV